MELTDSSPLDESNPTESTRSRLIIDLNEIPSPSSLCETLPDSFDVVQTYHENPTPPPGGPAGLPGDLNGSTCGACGGPEVGTYVVVCDGCERGFHLACAGMRVPVDLEEWVCSECLCSGVKSKRWPLGVKSKKRLLLDINASPLLLDINASPPSDADGEGNELMHLRKHTLGDNSFGGHLFGASGTSSNSFYSMNGFALQKASEAVTQTVKANFEDVMHHTLHTGRSFEEDTLGGPLGRYRRSKSTAVRLPSQNPSEIFLQALKAFISERNGVLEEGWRVEFKQLVGSCEVYAVYCAPDGKTFDSVYEVACYLGLMSNRNSTEPKVRREGSLSFSGKTYLPKKRKSKCSIANGFAETKDNSVNEHCREAADGLNSCVMDDDCVNTKKVWPEENGAFVSQKHNDGLPLQFEDFYVISLGEIDSRLSYHGDTEVYPLGYRSCWHDKITGSLFISEVLDGGDPGPIFKVKRCSCSSLPLPIGATLLSRRITEQFVREETDEMTHGSDLSIQMILSDPCPPLEDEILSCLSICSNGPCYSYLRDAIGEISVEESSSASAWKRMSRNFVKACSEIYKQKNTFKFFCNHAGDEIGFPNFKIINEKHKLNPGSLEKFCSLPSSISIPSGVHVENDFHTIYDELEKWLEQDRFGLDVEFVQEMLEQIPGIHSCSRYQFLNKRSECSAFLTVGNGLLEVKRNGEVKGKEDEVDASLPRSKKARLVGHHISPPSGEPLCSKVPAEITADVFQVWDLLSRFHEILGLKEAMSLEKLEKELVSSWVDGSNVLQNCEGGFGDIQATDYSGGQILTSGFESTENLHACIQMETRVRKETTGTKTRSATYRRCSGVALTEAHNSLLRVLIGELQVKVAALVDPNFDSGESKSRRGRRKDIDSSIPAKRMKLNLLPFNELTWPELARRYILAVLSMDGNLESAEITARESGKVFRCLQGDGGVLCGSLTGVAGMEADALLLAEATKQIFGLLTRENDVVTIEGEVPDAAVDCERVLGNDGNIPEWAQALEPVRKLPTNVGTRIRKCVHEALERDPPERARKILEHSISKEVYKGNASGPTKKAVLSLLADVRGEALPQKPEKGQKKKKIISISDIIMKQCRIVLRRAAAADDAKVFCNLLGRKLMNSSDNDEEGLLGSPATVSRPLDFRTIDLRLAMGSYGGSHEAFLEDVRELWNNVHNAFGDQPDLVELADSLSRNFESLYEAEVITLVHKLHEYAKSECLVAEHRKEVDDFLASTSEIPKAPWDEGVCKVCGIDKDDDSVLLCDTCDAEYHTYCLNPPLARIPEGNWYCPSCVGGKRMVQDALGCPHIHVRHRGKKYHGEVTRVYLEALADLAAAMDERDYWDFSVEERIFLLKYLCDEFLSSSLIRQHLEQCAEASAELQQKLRSLSIELRNLKYREEILTAKAAKLETDTLNASGEVGGKDEPLLKNSDGADLGGFGKHSSVTSVGNNCQNAVGTEVQPEDVISVANNDVAGSAMATEDNDKALLNESNSLPQEIDGSGQEITKSDVGYDVSAHSAMQSQAYGVELNSIKNDMLLLQESVTSTELELLKVSVRRDFLGGDSIGRLYWALVAPDGCPMIIASGSPMRKNQWEFFLHDFASSDVSNCSASEGSKVPCPFLYQPNSSSSSSVWVSYRTDAEIEQLIRWLEGNDPKERELKESILHWKKSQQSRNQDHGKQQKSSSMQELGEHFTAWSSCLVSRASALLEKKYGPFLELEATDILKKQVKEARLKHEEKIFRCECLEPVWTSRHHCFSCHRSFLTDVELEGHNDGKCTSSLLAYEKSKEKSDSLKGKGNRKFEATREESSEMDVTDVSKNGFSEFSSRLFKLQNETTFCPYDFEVICSKFLTKESNKDLVRDIGLIGSNGSPSFLPSLSPYLSESLLAFISQKGITLPGEEAFASGRLISQGNSGPANEGNRNLSNNSNRSASGYIGQRNRKFALDGHSSEIGVGRSCVAPQSSLRPLDGRVSQIARSLKIVLLDSDAALPEEALRPSKSHLESRWAWRAFVKSAETIYEMVLATIVFEDMIKSEYLKNEWWYWSSLSAAAKTSTISSLALRIYSLDAAIIYEKTCSSLHPSDNSDLSSISDLKLLPGSELTERSRVTRKSNKKRKEPEG